MPRAKTISQSEFPYNISARCINREWFHIPMNVVWSIFCEELSKAHREFNLQIYTFVLMSNHYHLLARTPDSNISKCMQRFMHQTSKRLTKEGNRINQTFAGRHYKCILQHNNYFLNAYKYNYRNPVASGLCSRPEDYPYSTLAGKLKPTNLLIPVCEDSILKDDVLGTLKWLNTPSNEELLEGFRFGVKHQYFKSKRNKNTRRLMISENDLL